MTNNNRVAVIIPIYNAELYLRRCIESVLNQEYSNFELILIDDGSSDTSGIICDDSAKLDNRVIVIHQRNSGVSNARNAGIDVADSNFLMFVDADDEIPQHAISTLISAMLKDDADIVTGSVEHIDSDSRPIETRSHREIGSISYDNLGGITRFLTGSEKSACARLYRSTTLSSVRFASNIKINEDKLFVLEAFKEAKTLVFNNDIVYRYREVKGSASRSEFNSNFLDIETIADEIFKSITRSYPTLRVAAEVYRLTSLIELFYHISKSRKARKEFSIKYNSLGSRIDKQSNLLHKRNYVKWLLLKKCPVVYMFIARMLKLVLGRRL